MATQAGVGARPKPQAIDSLTDEVLAAVVVDAIIELAFVHYSVNTCEQTKQTRLLLFFHSLSGFIYIFVLTQVVVAPLTASVVCLIHTPY
jgi:hypothetical protein